MTNEWTKARSETMRRNQSIGSRNRNIDDLNAMLGTKFKPMEFEPLPEPIGNTDTEQQAIGSND